MAQQLSPEVAATEQRVAREAFPLCDKEPRDGLLSLAAALLSLAAAFPVSSVASAGDLKQAHLLFGGLVAM